MRVQLVTRSAQRGPQKKTVVGEWLRVGRNASCEIHLADPRVALEQGMIVNREGLVYLEGESGSQNITRKSVRSVRLKPGEPIEVGPYRLTMRAAPQGFDGALELELVRPLEEADTGGIAERARRRSLASLGLGKRWASWALALAVLAVCLAIPAGRVLDLPWKGLSADRVVGDRQWNPGPVLLAHQPIEAKCATCHEVAFEHVKDRACLECHSTTGQHVGPSLQPAALFAGARCTSCHLDHKGTKPTHRDSDRFCVDCHHEVGTRAKGASAKNVSDFAADHPAFRLTLPTESGSRRVRQGEGPIQEASNLKFPHATHLDPAGVRSPLQGRMKLECKSCHQPDASKVTFQPIEMGRHCQECHQLQFEPAVTTREVPHGKPARALEVVDEFYAAIALRGTPDSFQKAFGVPGQGLLRRPGERTEPERRAALAMATAKAEQVGQELFEKRVCHTCHAVKREGDAWQVAPIRANARWMPQAKFDHRAHRQTACADCHDVAKSKASSDVAMPDIESCRKCHAGSAPSMEKVTSNCLLCHGFHDTKHPWDPAFQPKPKTRVAQTGDHAR